MDSLYLSGWKIPLGTDGLKKKYVRPDIIKIYILPTTPKGGRIETAGIEPFCVAQSLARLTKESEAPGLIPGLAHAVVKTDHEIFSTVVFPFSLIQEGQLSVIGENMSTWYWFTA